MNKNYKNNSDSAQILLNLTVLNQTKLSDGRFKRGKKKSYFLTQHMIKLRFSLPLDIVDAEGLHGLCKQLSKFLEMGRLFQGSIVTNYIVLTLFPMHLLLAAIRNKIST